MTSNQNTYVLGAGMTGLAAGMASGATVLEAAPAAGGICLSYYMRAGSHERLSEPPADGEVYRFENGGGHWIFGGDPAVLDFIDGHTPSHRYARVSSVFFHRDEKYVPYPLQNHMRHLDGETAARALAEMATPAGSFTTMQEWLRESFGETLSALFFEPFHQLYTADLYREIAPQDAYKSPVNMEHALRGALDDAPAVGYNTTFAYPENGLNHLAANMAERCRIEYNKRITGIDTARRQLQFADGETRGYGRLISTLPLHQMMEMTGLTSEARTDPHSAVLVLNIGAVKGEKCPADHWLYNTATQSGFHRVGFYSNVDTSFLPQSSRSAGDRVSIYVEKAYSAGARPSPEETEAYQREVVAELQSWGFIKEAEVVDPTWIEVAYTWSWPGSQWRQQAMAALQEQDIFQVGRYGRWVFQGIADSIRDGFIVGCSLKA